MVHLAGRGAAARDRIAARRNHVIVRVTWHRQARDHACTSSRPRDVRSDACPFKFDAGPFHNSYQCVVEGTKLTCDELRPVNQRIVRQNAQNNWSAPVGEHRNAQQFSGSPARTNSTLRIFYAKSGTRRQALRGDRS